MKLETLYLKETQIEKIERARKLFTKAFWRRQFQKESTESQRIFDWMFGVLLPVGCFLLDPIVFKGFRLTLMGEAKPFAYSLSFVSIMSLFAFKLWGENLKWLNGFLCGLFIVAGIVSSLLGIVLLPFSVIGAIFLIGILGFTPLFAGFVYLRNAVRCYQLSKPFVETKVLVNYIALGIVLSITLPLILNANIENEIRTMQQGNTQEIREAANKLKYVAPLADFNKLAEVSCDENDVEKNKALFESYYKLTGESMERINYIACNDF